MITDEEARRISYQWHGGGGSALYAFASTGAINTARYDHNAKQEVISSIRDTLDATQDIDALYDLVRLGRYFHEHEPRAAVAGWSALPLDPSPQGHPR